MSGVTACGGTTSTAFATKWYKRRRFLSFSLTKSVTICVPYPLTNQKGRSITLVKRTISHAKIHPQHRSAPQLQMVRKHVTVVYFHVCIMSKVTPLNGKFLSQIALSVRNMKELDLCNSCHSATTKHKIRAARACVCVCVCVCSFVSVTLTGFVDGFL